LAGVIGILGSSLSGCAQNGGETTTDVSSIKIKAGSIGTNYELNDVPSYDNLAIVVTTTDGKTKEMTWKANKTTITHNEIVTTTAGKFSFTVTYTPSEGNVFTDSVDYNVLKPFVDEVSAIKIKDGTIAKEFWENETVNYDSLAITVTKTTGTFDLLYKDNKDTITFENMNTATAGTFNFVVSYTPVAGSVFKDTIQYTVKTDTVSKIAVKTGSIATKYSRDETPNYDNLVIQVTRLSGVKELKAKGDSTITHTDIVTSELGTFDFKVTYTPVAGTSFDVIVKYEVVEAYENTINDIAIKDGTIDTSFWTDETPNYDALEIIVTKQSGVTEELLWKDNQTSITHTNIVTTVAASSLDFTVTYHSDVEDKDFTDTIQYEVKQDSIKGITIKDGFLNSSYILNDTVDYSTLTIIVAKLSGNVEMKWVDNKTTITYTDINTTALANGLTFTVTYKPSADDTFEASLTYDVIEKQDTYSATNWSVNAKYQRFLNKKAASTDAKDGSNNFMVGTDLKVFNIGNYNEVNLLPVINAIDPSTQVTTIITKLTNIQCTVSLSKTSDATSLNLSDYVEAADLDNVTSKGVVNFKDDLGTLDRDVTLTFKSKLTTLDDLIEYKLHIVDGFNISTAKDMLLIDNTKYSQDGWTNFKSMRDAIVTGGVNFENFVFLNDITIEKADLPTEYMWSASEVAGGATGANAGLIGTLKDYLYLYDHKYDTTVNPSSLNFYGNYNKVALGETFPYIFVESGNGSTNLAYPGVDNNSIDSHAALFCDSAQEHTPLPTGTSYSMNFFDLQAYGNQGVSTSQLSDPNVATSYKQGGVLFTKSFADMTYNNCIITHFFTINVNSGSTKAVRYPITTVNNSRLRDCFSTMMFNYADTKTVVNDSELTSAGGPLFINQCNEWTSDSWKSTALADRGGSYVIIDDTTKVENWVTGQGGWFDIYGATSALAALSTLNSSLFKDAGLTFYSAYQGNTTDMRLNMIAINMNSNAESAGSIKPGLIGGTSIGGVDYINYEGGKTQMDTDFNNGSLDSYAGFTKDIYSSHYGNLYSSSSYGNPIFVTHGKETAFFTTSQDVDKILKLSNTKGLITQNSADYSLTSDNKAAGYLGIYYYMNHQTDFTLTTASDFVSHYTNLGSNTYYTGSTAYGIVLGGYGTI